MKLSEVEEMGHKIIILLSNPDYSIYDKLAILESVKFSIIGEVIYNYVEQKKRDK